MGGDVWGDDAIRIMLDVTGRSDGSAGQRRQLFLSYMNALCGDLKLNKSNDFLARGADPGLKGDLQGCSRFNPLLIFSREKEDLFKTANRQRDKLVLGQRNDEDAPNRRVMVLIFRKGSRVLPAKWPCPTVKEGVGGCLKRFFSDGDARRSTHLSGTDGQFDQSHDTFACRFYQRISDQSPCNKTQKFALVRLYDGYQQFIPFAPFEATIGNRAPIRGTADDEGVAIIADAEIPSSCEIRWGFKPDQGVRPVLLFSRTIFLVASDETGDDTVQKKLSNLGYRDDDSATNIVAFQLDYGHLTDPFLTATGELGDATLDLLEKVYAEAANDLRRTQI
ncbi:MAG: peptidoglycan-binding domain-containing protein [Bryobacteraceae bacterium]